MGLSGRSISNAEPENTGGIAGEEILFVVPMMKIVRIPEPLIGAFLAIFCAIQMGLPDSFRTGANVTDNGIYAIGLNKLYRKRFIKAETK